MITRVPRLALIFAAVIGFSRLPVAVAEPEEAPSKESENQKSRDNEESEETLRLIETELPNWKLWKGPGHARELKLEPKPVLRWTNPGTGRLYGDVFVWTLNGRPEVVMSLYKAFKPAWGFTAEMHSLSLSGVEAQRDGAVVWQPTKAGIGFRDVPEAPKPADTAVRRLQQMRTLAGGFSAAMTDYRRNETGERQSLRLLPQPIYRYKSTDPDVLDGAMFAIVLGTDPEVFLLLEARSSTDELRWQYALARMNNDAVAVLHKDVEVWRVERAKFEERLREPYVLIGLPEAR